MSPKSLSLNIVEEKGRKSNEKKKKKQEKILCPLRFFYAPNSPSFHEESLTRLFMLRERKFHPAAVLRDSRWLTAIRNRASCF